jgi:hypothetical protein
MIRLFLLWLDKCCKIGSDRIKFRLGINEQYKDRLESITNFWIGSLGVTREKFQKPYIQKVIWKKKYEHPENYHGVLRIRVAKSTDLLL